MNKILISLFGLLVIYFILLLTYQPTNTKTITKYYRIDSVSLEDQKNVIPQKVYIYWVGGKKYLVLRYPTYKVGDTIPVTSLKPIK